MKTSKPLRVKEVGEKTGFHRRRLKLWEKYQILKPNRAHNKNEDRIYTDDDVERIIWADKLMKNGLSASTIRILIEYFTTGKITSYKWYK